MNLYDEPGCWGTFDFLAVQMLFCDHQAANFNQECVCIPFCVLCEILKPEHIWVRENTIILNKQL